MMQSENIFIYFGVEITMDREEQRFNTFLTDTMCYPISILLFIDTVSEIYAQKENVRSLTLDKKAQEDLIKIFANYL